MRDGTFDEIHTHRPWRILAKIDKLQTIRPELQGEFSFATERQVQARRPRRCQRVERGLKRLDANLCRQQQIVH